MNWLVTLSKDADLAKVKKSIESIGGRIDSHFSDNIILGDEVVISVSGSLHFPRSLKIKLKKW